MLVNHITGHLPISSQNALQFSVIAAWGIVAEVGAQKLCWDLCAGMGNTAIYSGSIISTISFTSKKEEFQQLLLSSITKLIILWKYK